jgi:hypothetical protein
MRPMHRWLWILAALLLLAGGCARRVQPATAPQTVAHQDDLPSWAPEHPSPEFLRAAKLLKAVPPEAEPYSPDYVPCWELFGSLTDQQLTEFTTWRYQLRDTRTTSKGLLDLMVRNGEGRVEGDRAVFGMRWVSVPVKSFSPRQRQLLGKYAAVYTGYDREPGKHDLLVELYRGGADQDLSNVDLFFCTSGHLVNLMLVGHSKIFPPMGSPAFAQIRESAAPRLHEKLQEEPRAQAGPAE